MCKSSRGHRGPGYWDCVQAVPGPTSSGLKAVYRGSAPCVPLQEQGASPTLAGQGSKRHLLPPALSFRTNVPSTNEQPWATASPLLLGGGEVSFSDLHVEKGGLVESIARAPGERGPAGVDSCSM